MGRLTLNLSGARVRRTDLSDADLSGANLSRADCSYASFRRANLKDAILDGTILVGADLTEAKNLAWSQMKSAVIDETTILPDYLTRERVSAE